MSLNWQWNSKCGELTFSVTPNGDKNEEREYTVSLYQGNAFLIFITEYKDETTGKDMYSLWNFWADKEHMKRCLGLVKGYENLFSDDGCRFVKLRLDKSRNHYWKDIVTAVAQAFDEIQIELYKEEEK